eukprot:scaffold55454_cov21-Prasinocladus_malaysianus.AAC.1
MPIHAGEMIGANIIAQPVWSPTNGKCIKSASCAPELPSHLRTAPRQPHELTCEKQRTTSAKTAIHNATLNELTHVAFMFKCVQFRCLLGFRAIELLDGLDCKGMYECIRAVVS